jgi:hypothetical protein
LSHLHHHDLGHSRINQKEGKVPIYPYKIYLAYALIVLLFTPEGQTKPNDRSSNVNMTVLTPDSNAAVTIKLKRILGEGEKVTVTQVTEAMLKLIVNDLSQLQLNQINPLVIRAVVPESPLSSALSKWAESRLSALIHQDSSIELRECIACKRQVTRIDGHQIVIKRGNLKQDTKSSIKNTDDFQSFFDLKLKWSVKQQMLFGFARILDQNGQEIWYENYRSGDKGELAKRGLNNLNEETSIKTYKRRSTPPLTPNLAIHELHFGTGARSGQGTFGFVARLGYAYGVFMGLEDQYMLAFQGSLSISRQRGFFDVNAEYRYRLSKRKIKINSLSVKKRLKNSRQGLWVKGIFGVPFSLVTTGLSLGIGAHYMTQYRVGIGATGAYAFNFKLPNGPNPGGPSIDINIITFF